MDMNAQRFSEKYAGTKWLISSDGKEYTATVIGYITGYDNFVLIKPDLIHPGMNIVVGHQITEYYPKRITLDGTWQDNKFYCNVHEFVKQINTDPPPKPYPHTCGSCKHPARIVGSNTLCSNSKCKSRKLLNKTYKSKERIQYNSTFASGRRYYLNAWRTGGCVICGQTDRGGCLWAHDNCYNMLTSSEKYELKGVCV